MYSAGNFHEALLHEIGHKRLGLTWLYCLTKTSQMAVIAILSREGIIVEPGKTQPFHDVGTTCRKHEKLQADILALLVDIVVL